MSRGKGHISPIQSRKVSGREVGQEHSLNSPEGETYPAATRCEGSYFLELRKQVSLNTEGVEGTEPFSYTTLRVLFSPNRPESPQTLQDSEGQGCARLGPQPRTWRGGLSGCAEKSPKATTRPRLSQPSDSGSGAKGGGRLREPEGGRPSTKGVGPIPSLHQTTPPTLKPPGLSHPPPPTDIQRLLTLHLEECSALLRHCRSQVGPAPLCFSIFLTLDAFVYLNIFSYFPSKSK